MESQPVLADVLATFSSLQTYAKGTGTVSFGLTSSNVAQMKNFLGAALPALRLRIERAPAGFEGVDVEPWIPPEVPDGEEGIDELESLAKHQALKVILKCLQRGTTEEQIWAARCVVRLQTKDVMVDEERETFRSTVIRLIEEMGDDEAA